MNIIQDLKSQFIQEAISSPILFNDLANMEKYIAESYKMRSIIELLQNADDAGSNKFKILLQGSTLFVANNGRNFNKDDLVSICRSGASTKHDKALYIGYRGIGFKSVVNFAQTIHVFSNELSFSFSKDKTLKLLQDNDINGDVPLIRVPHDYEVTDKFQLTVDTLRKEGFSVIFIFEDIHTDVISSEIKDYSPNTLLFLKNVDTVIMDIENKPITYQAIRTINNNNLNVLIKENAKSTLWNVIKSTDNNSPEAIAIPLNEQENIATTNDDDFLVYAFLPTKVKSGFNFLLNGSFNTDPSRTQIIIDQQTMVAIKNLIEIINLNVKKAIEEPTTANKDLINLISDLTINPIAKFKSSLSFSDVFKEELLKSLKTIEINVNGSLVSLSSIYAKPVWVNLEDYIIICNNLNFISFNNAIFREIPNLAKLFDSLNLKYLSVDTVVSSPKSLNDISIKGRIEVLKEYIKNNRFNFDSRKIDIFKSSPLFISLNEESFKQSLEGQIEKLDLSWLLSKLGIKTSVESPLLSPVELKISNNNIKSFSTKFSKWRSVEINVKAYFETLEDVISVTDVSKSNLGYDIEVQRKDAIEYIEVKSVTNLGDSFSLTNNEYGVANEKKNDYTLAIVRQSDKELELCLITNPIETLNLNRRVTRWEWICDEYAGTIKSLKLE